MSDAFIAFLRDPAVSIGLTIAAAIAAAAATATLLALRRRMEAIDAAQAKSAAFTAKEVKRLAHLVAQHRAEQIGDVLRQTGVGAADRLETIQVGPGDGKPIHQPLRKTIH